MTDVNTQALQLHSEVLPSHHIDGISDVKLRGILLDQWGNAGDAWLLGYADDGVIWGKISEGNIYIGADDNVPAAARLRVVTIKSLDVFNAAQQIHFRKDGAYLKVHHITDSPCNPEKGISIKEGQFLLGAFSDEEKRKISSTISGITYVRLENQGGSFHYLPANSQLLKGLQKVNRAKMDIRKYYRLNNEQDGWVFDGKRLLDIRA